MTLSQQRFTGLVAAAFGYMIKFTAYGFLPTAVVMTFVALVFVYITVGGPEVPFLQYIFFLFPGSGRGDLHLDEDDITLAYGVATMILFLLSLAGGWLLRALKRLFRRMFQPVTEAGVEEDAPLSQNPLSNGKQRLIVSSIVITVIYLVLFIVIPFAKLAEGTSVLFMYLLFAFFYVVAVIANALCIGIDTLSNIVLGWAWSRVLSGPESA